MICHLRSHCSNWESNNSEILRGLEFFFLFFASDTLLKMYYCVPGYTASSSKERGIFLFKYIYLAC